MTDTLLTQGQFYGTHSEASYHNGFLLSESCYEPNAKLPRHSHEVPFFCLLLEGSYRESYSSKEFNYSRHSIVFHPAGESHSTEMGNFGGSVFLIELDSPSIRILKEFSPYSETRFEPAGCPLSWLAQQIHRESTEGNGATLLTDSLLFEMLARTTKSEEPKFVPPWLSRVVEFIHSRFHSSLTVIEIAREIGIHPFHLSRVFRYFNGISIGEYVNRVRIDIAKKVLQKKHPIRLCELALDLGFADQSHFTRTFKKLTGLSPSSFRLRTHPNV